jgi:hypothetical protein
VDGRISRAAAAGALLVTVAAAGCGGDSDGFEDRAEAICRDGNAAIDRLAEDFAESGPTREQLEEVAPKMPVLMGAELDRLAALEPPPDLADEVDSMLASFRVEIERMRREGPAFFEHGQPFAAAHGKAEELGLDECAR